MLSRLISVMNMCAARRTTHRRACSRGMHAIIRESRLAIEYIPVHNMNKLPLYCGVCLRGKSAVLMAVVPIGSLLLSYSPPWFQISAAVSGQLINKLTRLFGINCIYCSFFLRNISPAFIFQLLSLLRENVCRRWWSGYLHDPLSVFPHPSLMCSPRFLTSYPTSPPFHS